jgi:hypothetical protein
MGSRRCGMPTRRLGGREEGGRGSISSRRGEAAREGGEGLGLSSCKKFGKCYDGLAHFQVTEKRPCACPALEKYFSASGLFQKHFQT